MKGFDGFSEEEEEKPEKTNDRSVINQPVQKPLR